MTQTEYESYRRRAVAEYAAEQVRAGEWSAGEAGQRAERQTNELLPDGLDTPGMALLVAETTDGVVGLVWVGRSHRERPGWWIYDIEVIPEWRGRGFGRALLEAAEREVRHQGGDSVGLNVVGDNSAARRLYESSGYDVISMQMGKSLRP